MCNNAGIGDEKNWRKMIDINLVGEARCVTVLEGGVCGYLWYTCGNCHDVPLMCDNCH